ncbi:MAG: toast rack family protein [Anaerolineae bacterium]
MKRAAWPPVLCLLSLIVLSAGCLASTPPAQPGEMETMPLDIPYPEGAEPVTLTLNFGAAEFYADAEGKALLEGAVTYNVPALRPEVRVRANNIEVRQEARQVPLHAVNKWDIHLGTERPMVLKVNAGAYDGYWELGGVPIQELEINQGASRSTLNFTLPNPMIMERLILRTGAADLEMAHLGNARFRHLTFQGGASAYTLDFTGQWTEDAAAEIIVGVASLRLIMPADLAVQVNVQKTLGTIQTDPDFIRDGRLYRTLAWEAGGGPRLEITIIAGLADIQLELAEKESPVI